jgi:hypothetical protein
MIKDNSNKYNNPLTDLERRATLARREERLAYKKYKNNTMYYQEKYIKLMSQKPMESLRDLVTVMTPNSCMMPQ